MMSLKRLVWDTQVIAQDLIKMWVQEPEDILFWRASSNFIYRYKHNEALFYLRFVHEGDKKLEQIKEEIAYLNYLNACHYPCVRPVMSKTGQWVQVHKTDKGDFYAVVFEGVKGEALGECELTLELVETWGALLGQLHGYSTAYEAKASLDQGIESLCRFIYSVFNHHQEDLTVTAAFDSVVEALSSLESAGCLKGYIHYDFEWDNILFNVETSEMNVLDFDDAMIHYYAQDVERCLNVIQDEIEDCHEKWEQAFLTGYKKHFHWGEAEQNALPALKAFASAYGLARLLVAVADSPEDCSLTWYNPLKLRIQNIIRLRRAVLTSWQKPECFCTLLNS